MNTPRNFRRDLLDELEAKYHRLAAARMAERNPRLRLILTGKANATDSIITMVTDWGK